MSKNLSKFVIAVVVYVGFAVYLYQPYFKHFDKLDYLVIVNLCLGSAGCFVLTGRWLAEDKSPAAPQFAGAFFAGAIYGFGPFTLALVGYHPIGGLLSAAVPWLFCPAVFAYFKDKWRWISQMLLALPVLVILLFFEVSAHYRLFAIPIQAKLHLANLLGLLAPLVTAEQGTTLVGFYQVPIAALIMGIAMLLSDPTGKKLSAAILVAERRLGGIIIFCLGTILAFCGPVFNISPIIWLSFPVLCCSVLIGTGMQALARDDLVNNKCLPAIAVIMTALSVSTWFLWPFGSEMTAVMYILGATAVSIIFFMARAKLHLAVLRLAILGLAMAVDIFFSARFIVDKTF